MDDSSYLLNPLLSCKVRNKKFKLLLNACEDQHAFNFKSDSKFRDTIADLNARLNELALRPSGIQLLKTILNQCSDQVFIENSIFWMTQCLKAAVNYQDADEAYDILCLLIEMSHNFQELTKLVAGKVIPKVLDTLLTAKNSAAALQCLQTVLHWYPGPCKVKLKSVQTFLLQFVDEENQTVVEYAGRCMCYLPLLQVTGSNNPNAWTDVLSKLCANANTLMYELFENVPEVILPTVLAELTVGFDLKTVNVDDPIISYYNIAKRLANILTFIEGMIVGDLQCKKAVRTDILVALAYRALAINCKMVSRGRSMEHVALVTVLPDVHKAAFNLLGTLVSCFPGALIKFGPLFCKLVLQTLKWTSVSSEYGMERPYRLLRVSAYKFLESWVLRALAASCVELMAEELVTLMLKDVYQKRESVTLQFQDKGKKITSTQQLPQGRQLLANVAVNVEPCEAALQALCALIQTSGSLFSPSLHMRLQETCISLLLDIQRASGPEDTPLPYSVSECRLGLFRLLLLLTLHPHPRWPPPTQFALSLFPWGQHDPSIEIAGFCSLALACTRQMLHPSQSCHQFPMPLEEIRASVELPNLTPVKGPSIKGEELAMNGEVLNHNSNSSPDKPCKRKRRSNFMIEELDVSNRKTSRKSFKEWEVVDVTPIENQVINEKGDTEYINSIKTDIRANHDLESPNDENLERSQIEKVNETIKESSSPMVTSQNFSSDISLNSLEKEEESVVEVPIKTIYEKNSENEYPSKEKDENTNLKRADEKEPHKIKLNKENVDTEEEHGLSVKTNKICDENKREVNETREQDMGRSEIVSDKEKYSSDEMMEVNSYNLRKEKVCTQKNPSNAVSDEMKTELEKISSKKNVFNTPKKSNEPVVNIIENLGSSVKKTRENNSKVKSSKNLTSVEEITVSSDSEPEQMPNKVAGVCRRITRSLAKQTSTPQKRSNQDFDVDENPSSQDSITTEMLKEIVKIEEETNSSVKPTVDLDESDESADITLRIETSDKESEEVNKVSNDSTGVSNEETFVSAEKELKSSVAIVTNNFKDSNVSDSKIEEVAESAVATIKDSESCKITEIEMKEVDNNSESAEEEILKTFVNVVSPELE